MYKKSSDESVYFAVKQVIEKFIGRLNVSF